MSACPREQLRHEVDALANLLERLQADGYPPDSPTVLATLAVLSAKHAELEAL